MWTSAQIGTVTEYERLGDSSMGFHGVLAEADLFGSAVTCVGDLDSNGVPDLAVAAVGDDGGSPGFLYRGAVHVLRLGPDFEVLARTRIRSGEGGFGGVLSDGDRFGHALAALGDIDGDGHGDLAVGAPHDDDGGTDQGAVWILFLNADGTVKAENKLSTTTASGGLQAGDLFGSSLTALGDLDNDGVTDLGVGATGDDDGTENAGALWILFLNTDGSVKAEQKISRSAGGFGGSVGPGDAFGASVATIGDLDGNGVTELAIGAPGNAGALDRGAVWILFLQGGGTVIGWHRINGQGELAGALKDFDFLGSSMAALGDLDGDGVPDVIAGAPGDDASSLAETREGAAWILFLNADGTLKAHHEIDAHGTGFDGVLAPGDLFGTALTNLGDLDGDGAAEIACGATGDDDGAGEELGAVWILHLEGDTQPPVISCPTALHVPDEKGGLPGRTVSFVVTAADDADPSPLVLCIPPSGSYFPRGTTQVTCLATDNLGNLTVCTFPVTVAPTMRRP